MRTVPLGSLSAAIFTGLVPARLKRIAGGTPHKILHVRNVELGLSSAPELESTFLPTVADVERCLLRAADVVITARGTNIRAAVASPEHVGVVAGPNLIVVRLLPDFLPDLLVALIRHPKTQSALLDVRAGTGTPGFTVNQLASMLVSVPGIEVQHDLAKLSALSHQYYANALAAAELRISAAADRVYSVLGGSR